MKRIVTVISFVLLSTAAFSQQDTLAQWTFPTGNETDTLPDRASSLNVNQSVFTLGGVSPIAFKNGATTKAAQATKWDNGAGTKAWAVTLNTTGYQQLKVSSKHTAGGSNPGPRDLLLQYKVDPGDWTDVEGGAITVGNDWTTGVISGLPLPEACSNQANLVLRWVTTSTFDINGDELASSGIAKIDDIYINGQVISGTSETELANRISVYPNPCSGRLTVESPATLTSVEIYAITGTQVYRNQGPVNNLSIPVGNLEPGKYFLVIRTGDQKRRVETVIVR
jgi:hypothetical protein